MEEDVRQPHRSVQAEHMILYYDITHGFDDSYIYFWEKESLELKAQGRAIHFRIKAFAEDPMQTVLEFPPLHPELRSQVYLSAKKFDLFTHAEGIGQDKRINVYKEERVDDFTDEVKKFLADKTQTELSFPPSLTSKERSNLHDLAKQLNLYSVSVGGGSKRHIVLSKQKREVAPSEMSQKARKIFLSLTSLPIPVTTSPLFEYFIDLYQPLLQSKDRLMDFLQVVEKAGGESKLMQHYGDFKKDLEKSLKQTDAYKKLTAEGISSLQKQYGIPEESLKRLRQTKPVFSPTNHGLCFLSLDLRSANFNCLKNHDPGLVLGCRTWEELAAKATPHKIIQESKMLRQIVLGTLAGKKQLLMWQYVTYKIYAQLINNEILNDDALVSWSGDELVFNIPFENLKGLYRKVKAFITTDPELQRYADFIKVEAIRLIRLKESSFYVKEIFTNLDREDLGGIEEYAFRPVIKCANAQEFAQCFKVYIGEPINKNDAITEGGQERNLFT